MSGFATRWVVADEHPVATGDVDTDGLLTAAALERMILAAGVAYVARCERLRARQQRDGLRVQFRITSALDAARLRGATGVLVSARATEFLPDSFAISVRVRAADGVLDTMCTVWLEDAGGNAAALGDDIRDELIALEHAAAHVN